MQDLDHPTSTVEELKRELDGKSRDLSEALEYQTAVSEILRIISSSPNDAQLVFDTIARSVSRLCKAVVGESLTYCHVFRFDGELVHLAAVHGLSTAGVEHIQGNYPMRPGRGSAASRSIVGGTVEQIPDVLADPNYTHGPTAKILNYRSIVAVPILKDDRAIGAIAMARSQPGRFPERQIELLRTFADQAVIAIENTRLFEEVQARTHTVQEQSKRLAAQADELAQWNDTLKQRVNDQLAEIERMNRLRRFLSPQIAELVVSSGGEQLLESHRRQITALFCDLRGFTGFAETAEPEEVMQILREYHEALGKLIHKYGATLEHFAGDGVMVWFNDPLPCPDPCERAVRMAVEMRAGVAELAAKWRRQGHALGFGVGIAHGYATLGRIGFEGRFDYAAVGTVVNLAARLCSEAQDGQILIDPKVQTAIESLVATEPAGQLALKGLNRPIAAFKVVDQ